MMTDFDRRIAEEFIPEALYNLGDLTRSIGEHNSSPTVTNTGAQLNYAIRDKNFYSSIGMTEQEYRQRPVEGIARAAIYQASHVASDMAREYYELFRREDPNASEEELEERAVKKGLEYGREVMAGLKDPESSGAYLASLAASDRRGALAVNSFYGRRIHTPLTAGVDIGSPTTAFLTQAGENTLTMKLLKGFWNQDSVAAMLEANRDQQRYGTEGLLSDQARNIAYWTGTAASFGEMMIAAKLGGKFGLKATAGTAAAGKSKAALGSGAYFLINSALNDTMYRKGAASRYWSKTDVHDRNIGAWIGSRLHDLTTYWATMAITGPWVTKTLGAQFHDYRPDSFGKALWFAAHPIVNSVADAALDTTVDLGAYLAAESLVGANYFTEESQRLYSLNRDELFSQENLLKFGNMWLRRASLRVANQMVAKPIMRSAGEAITGRKRVQASSNFEDRNWWERHLDAYWDGNKKLKGLVSTVGSLSYKYAPNNLAAMQRLYDADPSVRPHNARHLNFADALAQGKLDNLLYTSMFIESERAVNAIYDLSLSADLISIDADVSRFIDIKKSYSRIATPQDIRAIVTTKNQEQIANSVTGQVQKILTDEKERYYTEHSVTPEMQRQVDTLLERGVTPQNRSFYDSQAIIAQENILKNASEKAANILSGAFVFQQGAAMPLLGKGDLTEAYVNRIADIVSKRPSDSILPDLTDEEQSYRRDVLSEVLKLDRGDDIIMGKSDLVQVSVIGATSRNDIDVMNNVSQSVLEFERIIRNLESLPETTRKAFMTAGYFNHTQEGGLYRTGYVETMMKLAEAIREGRGDDMADSMLDLVTKKSHMTEYAQGRVVDLFKQMKAVIDSDLDSRAKGEQLHHLGTEHFHLSMLFGGRFNLTASGEFNEQYRSFEEDASTTGFGYRKEFTDLTSEYYKETNLRGHSQVVPIGQIHAMSLKRRLAQRFYLHSRTDYTDNLWREGREIAERTDTDKAHSKFDNLVLNAVHGLIQSIPEEINYVNIKIGTAEQTLTRDELVNAAYNTNGDDRAIWGLLAIKALSRDYVSSYVNSISNGVLNRDGITYSGDKALVHNENMNRDLRENFGIEEGRVVVNVSEDDGGNFRVSIEVKDPNEVSPTTYIHKIDDSPQLFRQYIDNRFSTVSRQNFIASTASGPKTLSYREIMSKMSDEDISLMDDLRHIITTVNFSMTDYSEIKTISTYSNLREYVANRIDEALTSYKFNDEQRNALADKIISEATHIDDTAVLKVDTDTVIRFKNKGLKMEGIVFAEVNKAQIDTAADEEAIIKQMEKAYPDLNFINIGHVKAGYIPYYIGVPYKLSELDKPAVVTKFKNNLKKSVLSVYENDLNILRKIQSPTPAMRRYQERSETFNEELTTMIDRASIGSQEDAAKLMLSILKTLNDRKIDDTESVLRTMGTLEGARRIEDTSGATEEESRRITQAYTEMKQKILQNEAEYLTAIKNAYGEILDIGERIPEALLPVNSFVEKWAGVSLDVQGVNPRQAMEEAINTVKEILEHAAEATEETTEARTALLDLNKVSHALDNIPEVRRIDRDQVITLGLQKFEQDLMISQFNSIVRAFEQRHGGYEDGNPRRTEAAITLSNLRKILSNNIEKKALTDLLRVIGEDEPGKYASFLEAQMYLYGLTGGRNIYAGETKRAPYISLGEPTKREAIFDVIYEKLMEGGQDTFTLAVADIHTDRHTDPYDGIMATSKTIRDILHGVTGNKIAGGFGAFKVHSVANGETATGFSDKFVGLPEDADIVLTSSVIKALSPDFYRLFVQPQYPATIRDMTDPRLRREHVHLTREEAAFLMSKYVEHVEQIASVERRDGYSPYTYRSTTYTKVLDNYFKNTEETRARGAYGPRNVGESTAQISEGTHMAETMGATYRHVSSYQMLQPLPTEPDLRISPTLSSMQIQGQRAGDIIHYGSRQEIDVPLQTLVKIAQKIEGGSSALRKALGTETAYIDFLERTVTSPESLSRDQFTQDSNLIIEILSETGFIMKLESGSGPIYVGQLVRQPSEHGSHFLPVVIRGVRHPMAGDQVAANELFRLLNSGDFDGDQVEFSRINKEHFKRAMASVAREAYEDRKNLADNQYTDQQLLRDIFRMEAETSTSLFEAITDPVTEYPTHSALLSYLDPKISKIGPTLISVTVNEQQKRRVLSERADKGVHNISNRVMKNLAGKITKGVMEDSVEPSLPQFTRDKRVGQQDLIIFTQKDASFDKAEVSAAFASYPLGSTKTYKGSVDNNNISLKFFFSRDDSVIAPGEEGIKGSLLVGVKDESARMGHGFTYMSKNMRLDEAMTLVRDADFQREVQENLVSLYRGKDAGITIGTTAFKATNDPNLRIAHYDSLDKGWSGFTVDIGNLSALQYYLQIGEQGVDRLASKYSEFLAKVHIAQGIRWGHQPTSKGLNTFDYDLANHLGRSLKTGTAEEKMNLIQNTLSSINFVKEIYQEYVKDSGVTGKQAMDTLLRLVKGKNVDPSDLKVFYNNQQEVSMLAQQDFNFRVLHSFLNTDVKNTTLYKHYDSYVDMTADEIRNADFFQNNMKLTKGLVHSTKGNELYRQAYILSASSNFMRNIPPQYASNLIRATESDNIIVMHEHLNRYVGEVTRPEAFARIIFDLIHQDPDTQVLGISKKDIRDFLQETGIGINTTKEGEATKFFDSDNMTFLPLALRQGHTDDYKMGKQVGYKLTLNNKDATTAGFYKRLESIMSAKRKESFDKRYNAKGYERSKVIATALTSFLDLQTQVYMTAASMGLADRELVRMLSDRKGSYVTWNRSGATVQPNPYKITSPELIQKLFDNFRFDVIYNTKVDWGFTPTLRNGSIFNC